MAQARRTRIENSGRARLHHSMACGPLAGENEIDITVVLRENPAGPSLDDVSARLARQSLAQRRYYTREQFARVHGASADDLRTVRAFAARNRLEIVETSVGARSVRLRGTVADINAAFGVQLQSYAVSHRGRVVRYHSHSEDISVDEGLVRDRNGKQRLVAVLGLDTRPIAQPQFQRRAEPKDGAAAPDLSHDPVEVARAYNYPAVDGRGVVIGLIELGGSISDADVTAYFQNLGLPAPIVKHVSVDGAVPMPDPGDDIEVALDVEVVGAMAPGCTIVIYDAPNTEQGMVNAIAAAANDTVNKPVCVSLSWLDLEQNFSLAGMQAMDHGAKAGGAMGTTFTVSAGDWGTTDWSKNADDGIARCYSPASAPHFLAVGGTTLLLNPDGTIASETVWGGSHSRGATGGGVSDVFDVPDYQRGAGIVPVSKNPNAREGRGVPDVAGVADPATGYRILSNGKAMVIGGTSAAAPQWAALLALGAKQQGKGYGFIHPLLYAVSASGLRDITVGNNGYGNDNGYVAQKGYDLCTGRGTPDGRGLLAELAVAQPALSGPDQALDAA